MHIHKYTKLKHLIPIMFIFKRFIKGNNRTFSENRVSTKYIILL